MSALKLFIESLKMYSGKQVFNPWSDYDSNYDIGKEAPGIRCAHLETYLRLRIAKSYLSYI